MPYDPSDLRLPPWLVRFMDVVVRVELRLGPWRLGLTRPGALFLATLLGVAAAAVYSGNNLLYLCGAMFAAFGAAGLISGATLLRRLPALSPLMPDHTLAGISHVIRETLSVSYPFSALVDITWRGDDEEAPLMLGLRLGRGTAVFGGAVLAERRGIETLRRLIFETSAPLGLWRLVFEREEVWEWVVAPTPVPMLDGYDSARQRSDISGDEWRDLRGYVPGDLRSRIHWRKLAAGIADPQQWLVKRFAAGTNDAQAALLRVDTRLPEGTPPAALDRLLGQAVSWVSQPPLQRPDERRLIVGSAACDVGGGGIWRMLAGATPGANPPSGRGGTLLSLVDSA